MNKYLFLVGLLPIMSLGQEFCATDKVYQKINEKNILSKTLGEEIKLHSHDSFHVFGTSSAYNGPIYEIPVVVHVIESTASSNLKWSVSDQEVKDWLEVTNKIYATTYGNGYYPEGNGVEGGTVMPFKLVLAQRTSDCQATTGIIRYNGSTIRDYDDWGVVVSPILKDAKDIHGNPITTIGKSYQEHVRALAPHWDEGLYYNIYIVVGLDGVKERGNVGGVAGYPYSSNQSYEAFIKAAVVKDNNNSILAHEFGHSLGLEHPFDGEKRTDNPSCPKNDDCNTHNDKVCDTEPIGVIPYPVPTNSDTNPCTATNWKGTQYNIMGYTYEPKKFTVGQRERALNLFFRYRGGLVKSRGAVPITSDSEVNMIKACIPQRVELSNTFDIGITNVTLNTINNSSGTQDTYYIDYSLKACRDKTVLTDIKDKEESTITVKTGKRAGRKQKLKAWIDYNNNGVFENNEIIVNENVQQISASITKNFTPPETAVKDTYLRLRVMVDDPIFGEIQACDNPTRGQIEDYAVRIVSKKNEITTENDNYVGRVGINTDKPRATLDIREVLDDTVVPKTQAQGVLFPSFTSQERDVFTNVKEGTMIYNKTEKCIEMYKDGQWVCLSM